MMKARRRIPHLDGALFIVALLLVWELIVRFSRIHDVPSPSVIALEIWINRETMALELLRTLQRAGVGLVLSIVTMIPAGIVIGRSIVIAEIVEPVIEVLRPLPTPAIVPIVMLIAGIGDSAKIVVVFYGAAFPILLNTIDGVRALHPMFTDTARSLRLTRFETFALIDLPAALPQIMAGIRTSVSIAILISVTAEMLLSTNGIGVFILQSQERFRIADCMGGIIVIAAASFAVNTAWHRLDRWLLRWHHEGVADQSVNP
jgi:NitT/TauT family transport system permease protein/sulfonate transport system permease protein